MKNRPSRQAATLAATFPFSAATMAAYAADYQNLREILDKPKEFPLRIAVLQDCRERWIARAGSIESKSATRKWRRTA